MTARKITDTCSWYDPAKMSDRSWLNRFIWLETVAAVPGMVGGGSRHMKSVRRLKGDNGWINHLI